MKHEFTVRIIYRDTDAEGVVYYANYLGFMEQGRTELLRKMGISLPKLKKEMGIVFAVKEVKCQYKAPAFYDDELTIETSIIGRTGATITFSQKAIRGEQVLVEAEVVNVAMKMETMKPARIPAELLEILGK